MIRVALTSALLLVLALVAGCGVTWAVRPSEINGISDADLDLAWRRAHVLDVTGLSEWGGEKSNYYTGLRREAVRRAYFNAEDAALVEEGQIDRGMQSRAVYWSWGPARSVERTTSPYGKFETWTYGHPGYSWSTVSLHNGAVTWWSVHR